VVFRKPVGDIKRHLSIYTTITTTTTTTSTTTTIITGPEGEEVLEVMATGLNPARVRRRVVVVGGNAATDESLILTRTRGTAGEEVKGVVLNPGDIIEFLFTHQHQLALQLSVRGV